jgi:hypothetical protein
MRPIRPCHWIAPSRFLVVALGLLLALPAGAYDFPLTSNAIRDAYFLGKRQTGLGTDFLAQYSRSIPELKVDPYISRVRIETPFFQVAEQVSRALNYSAQDAVKDFYDKPAVLRMHLEICYEADAPLPNSVRIGVIQKNKPIAALSEKRSAFFPPSDAYTRVPNLGEKVTLEFDPGKLDSSALTIQIHTPDGRHAECVFDMQAIR